MNEDRPRRPVVRWAPRVPKELIRRLYESDAGGIRDDDLAAAVGCALYARCRSILVATAAHNGQVECPGCGSIVPHAWGAEEILRCERCGWEMRWRSYRDTFHGQRLLAGGASEAFAGFVRQFEAARTYRDRLLAIDRLVHAFHRDATGNASAPAARNVIEGTVGEVLDLLDALAYGDVSEPGLAESRDAYRDTLERADGHGHLKRRAKGP
jgi:hypothetical protein